MLKLDWSRAARWRLRRHFLDRRAPPGSLLAVTSRLCGLHAQVLSCAELTAWSRVEGLARGEVTHALWEERTLVKTWAMRGTLHLLPSGELPMWHAALRINPRYLRSQAWQNYFGMTVEELDAFTQSIGRVLVGGQLMTREELVKAVGTMVADTSWGTTLKPAAFSGLLCFAPSVGQRVRFTHPYTWLGKPATIVAEEEATAAVTRRFLSAYAPATIRDLARWWGGGGMTAARKWMAALGDEVAEVEVGGTPAWMLAEDVKELRGLPVARSVRLLPGFDQYVVGASSHAEQLFPEGLRSRIYRPQGWISPVLLVNGRMEGVWHHDLKGSSVEVTIEPFGDVPAWVRKAAAQEAERLAQFLGAKLTLRFPARTRHS